MPEYRTPGVYIEEISAGPRPVQASSTTDTGFVAVLTLPTSFSPGAGKAAGMFLPGEEDRALLAWNRARAFRPLGDAPSAAPEAPADGGDKKSGAKKSAAKPAGGNRLQSLLDELLPGKWNVAPPNGENVVTLQSAKGQLLRFPVSRSMMSVKEKDGAHEWDLAFGADEAKVVELIAGYAVPTGVTHSGSLSSIGAGKPVNIDPDAIHTAMAGPAPLITNMTSYTAWRLALGEQLFKEIVMGAQKVSPKQAEAMWAILPQSARSAWDSWIRHHPGIHRFELALLGFFENGGASAFVALVIQAHGAAGPNKRGVLDACFDNVGAVAMLAAPGLEHGWQQAILEYAGPKGRGDLFAVLETPRYLLTRAPNNVELDPFRWVKGDSPYEIGVLETVADSNSRELRFGGFASDELLDRTVPRDDAGYGGAYGPWLIVDNPLSTGAHDRYVIAPPAGHVAGVIAATDLKAGGGVHKAPANEQVAGLADLVTEVSDKEQGFLNMKNINIIRHRPGAGIRVWGARTVASDALWRYVNVRRLFLYVERSIRDAVNWAVFLPNSDVTRRDLATTIRSFLFSLWNQGMLDGATHQDAYNVKCDRENNPDVDIRSGLLTVDVVFRPLYPAEFVRIRFQQAPMEVPG